MKKKLLISIIIITIVSIVLIGSCQKRDPILEIYERSSVEELFNKGNKFLKTQNPDSALIYFSLVTNKYKEPLPNPIKNTIADAYSKLGYVYLFYKNDYISSYSSLLNALEILEKTGETSLYPAIYLNLGNIFLDYGDKDRMMDFHKKSFRYSVNEKDWRTLMIVMTSMLSTAISEGNPDMIKEEVALLDTLKLPDTPDFRALRLQRESLRALSDSNYKAAITYLQQAKETGDMNLIQNRYKTDCNLQISDILKNQGKDEEAILFIKENLMGPETEALDIKKYISNSLADLYMAIGRSDSVIKYMNQHKLYTDSLFKSQQYSLLSDINTMHEVRKLDNKIQDIEGQRNKTRLALWFSVGLLGIFLTFGIIVSLQNKKLKQRNLDLFRHNAHALEQEQKERALRELYEKQIKELSQKKIPEETNPREASETADGKESKKYKNSHLSEAMQTGIFNRIESVMNDENEIVSNDFSLDRLASLVASNTSYVSQIINELYGKNFHTLLGEARIKLACNRLCDPKYDHLTMEGIANELGFKSRTNFISIFKKFTGLTPSEYRKISKKSSL